VLKKMFKAMPTADLKECSLLVFKMVKVNLVEVKGFHFNLKFKVPFDLNVWPIDMHNYHICKVTLTLCFRK